VRLALLFLPIALVGAGLGRWTRWPVLAIAALLGFIPGTLGLMAMAAFSDEGRAILLFAGAGFLMGGAIAAIGAFVGRLRRTHVERNG
jgi:hypothetical protein